jgi:hypothetical protein
LAVNDQKLSLQFSSHEIVLSKFVYQYRPVLR